jgi:hypothetical protein
MNPVTLPGFPLLSERYFCLHAACDVAYLSGAAEYVDRILYEMVIILACDGTSADVLRIASIGVHMAVHQSLLVLSTHCAPCRIMIVLALSSLMWIKLGTYLICVCSVR